MSRIDHIALYCIDLEAMREFWMAHFGCTSNKQYHNPCTTGDGYYESCIQGPEGMLIEITV